MATGGCIVPMIAVAMASAGTAPTAPFTDLATPFESGAIDTRDRPMAERIAAMRVTINSLLPGLYRSGSSGDQAIAEALNDFPATRPSYDRVIADFPSALNSAIARFRKVFPRFTSLLPIYLYHSLGQRDGGSDYLDPGHRQVMLFGADMIAKYHSDDSLQPFIIHELFHLQHARAFAGCNQLWCNLWQEGLAVDAAATMTPRPTDHQLLLDIPVPIRAPTDARWGEALCFVAMRFDSTDDAATAKAFSMGGKPPKGLPDRFGYYVGWRIAQATGITLPQLSRLDNKAARPVVRAALTRLIRTARVDCAAPAVDAAVFRRPPPLG